MVKTAESTWAFGPNMPGHLMKRGRVCCSCGMQFSSTKSFQVGETLKTTPLVDAVSAWRRLNSDVIAVISPCYCLPLEATNATVGYVSRKHPWLSPTPAARLPKPLLMNPPPTAALLWGVSQGTSPSQLHGYTLGNNRRFTMPRKLECPD